MVQFRLGLCTFREAASSAGGGLSILKVKREGKR
jgi:hypothetical protein